MKSYLIPDKAGLGKRKASEKKRTINPLFNEILRVSDQRRGVKLLTHMRPKEEMRGDRRLLFLLGTAPKRTNGLKYFKEKCIIHESIYQVNIKATINPSA